MSRFAIQVLAAFGLSIGILPAGETPRVQPASHEVASGRARFSSDRPAQLEPFDLTYLPHPISEIQAITAIRPAAIFAHPAFRPHARSADDLFSEVGQKLGGARAKGPGIEAIESLILCGTVETQPNEDPATKEDKPYQMTLGGRGFVVRTTKPYDWAGAVRGWFPCSAVAHRGADYLATPLSEIPLYRGIALIQLLFEMLSPGARTPEARLAFYIPDERTLVIENEERVRELIERLKSGKRDPLPPGWEQVSRGALAMAIDNREKQWSQCLFKRFPGPHLPNAGEKLFANANYLTLGLEFGPISRFKLIAVCPHQFAAKEARHAGRPARKWFADCFAPDTKTTSTPTAEGRSKLMDALLLDGVCKPTPLGFEYVGEVRENLLSWLTPF